LPKSHSHYRDYLDLRGDGRIVLYKRADHQNPKWTVRLKLPETEGFVVKSTKTTDDFEARRFAEDLYYRLEGRVRRNEPVNTPLFRKVFLEWAKVPVADQLVRNGKYLNGNVRRVELWALQYFGDVTIEKVTDATLADYLDWRLSQPKRPAISTLKNERTAIRELLKFAKRRGYLSAVPEFPIKSGKANARPVIQDGGAGSSPSGPGIRVLPSLRLIGGVLQGWLPACPPRSRGLVLAGWEEAGPLLAPAHLRHHEDSGGRQRLSARGEHGDFGRDDGRVLRQEADA
jgi:hypothetical protein